MKYLVKQHQKYPVKEYQNNVIAGPLVSVCVQTYQQKSYIRECLDGILMQKTSFSFELIVGEDDSSDGTREVCIEYAKNYPRVIKLLLHNRQNNIRISGQSTGRFNFLYNLHQASGKYIALCDGDDYWIDPYKLQKQIGYLEANPLYGLVHSDSMLLNNATGELVDSFDNLRNLNIRSGEVYDALMINNYIYSATLCFRRALFVADEDIKLIANNFLMADYPLSLLIAKKSKVGYIEEPLAVRRVLLESASQSRSLERLYKFHNSAQDVRTYFMDKYGYMEETKKQVFRNYYSKSFYFAYRLSKPDLARKAYSFFRENKIKLTLYQLLFYYGTVSREFAALLKYGAFVRRFFKK
jgi:glycosyltransferase involved in cell wall biosynthesis